MNQDDKYMNELYEIIHENRMYDYEEVNMAYIAAKLIQLQAGWGKNFSLVLRSDFIEDETYWFIRYFRSKNIEPAVILSTTPNKEKYYEGVLGIPVAVIGEMNIENTKNSVLIIINRESDREILTQEDYKESDYGFCFRARGKLQFTRKRGMANYLYILQNEDEYYKVLNQLEDEESKQTFVEIIRCLLENDIYRYNEYEPEIKYFDDSIYKSLGEKEVWINCGSCTGDTIIKYLLSGKDFGKIYAVEIDKKMIDHLNKLFSLFPKDIAEKILLHDRCLEGAESTGNIDHIFEKENISLINMDIEGAELMVLEGASQKIREDMPVLAVAAYHKPEDLITIPQFICRQSSDYHIFFRKYKGYCPEVINEYIYYAVPTHRMA